MNWQVDAVRKILAWNPRITACHVQTTLFYYMRLENCSWVIFKIIFLDFLFIFNINTSKLLNNNKKNNIVFILNILLKNI